MGSYKNLLLENEFEKKLAMNPPEWVEEGSISCEIKSDRQTVIHFRYDGKNSRVDVWKKNNETTTLTPYNGDHGHGSENFCTYIIDHHQMERAVSHFSFKPFTLTDAQVQECFQFLRGGFEIDVKEDIHPNDAGGKKYVVKKKPFGAPLTISLYKTGTLVLQGTPFDVFCWAKEFFSDALGLSQEERLKRNNDLFKVNISLEEIVLEAHARMPTSFDQIPNHLQDVFTPSLLLLRTNVDLSDYTALAFPALRALEGLLWFLIERYWGANNGTPPDTSKGFGNVFCLQNGATTHTWTPSLTLTNNHVKTLLEEMYHLYRSQRNEIFHANQEATETRILTSRTEAENIVVQVTNIFERAASFL